MRKAVVTLIAIVLLLPLISSAGEITEWKVEQVTSCRGGFNSDPNLTPDADAIFFISNCDYVNDNPDDSNEIFSWSNGEFQQLTDEKNCETGKLVISPDGSLMAFVSNCWFGNKNPERSFNLAVMDRKGEARFLTKGGAAPPEDLAWFPDSSSVAFISRSDYTGNNEDNSEEVFVVSARSPSPEIKQLTSTSPPGGCESPSPVTGAVLVRCNGQVKTSTGEDKKRGDIKTIDPWDGKKLGNPDGNHEIWSITLSGEIKQITDTVNCVNYKPLVGPRGQGFVFSSTCEFGSKGNVSFYEQKRKLYIYMDGPLNVFEEDKVLAMELAWSGDGSLLALSAPGTAANGNTGLGLQIFAVEVRPAGENEDGKKGFSFDRPREVTSFSMAESNFPSVSRFGNVIAFVSNANPEGENTEAGTEIFIARKVLKKN